MVQWQRLLFLGLIISLNGQLTGCNGNQATTLTPAVQVPKTVLATKPVSLSTVCLSRMQQFLRWYLRFEARGDSSTLLFNYPVTDPNDPHLYRPVPRANVSRSSYIEFNRTGFTHYLDSLKASGYFSASYLTNKRISLLKRGTVLDKAHVTEPGEMTGFEADEIFWIQELYAPEDVKNLRTYQTNGLKTGSWAYQLPIGDSFGFYLFVKNENGRCVIDSITHN